MSKKLKGKQEKQLKSLEKLLRVVGKKNDRIARESKPKQKVKKIKRYPLPKGFKKFAAKKILGVMHIFAYRRASKELYDFHFYDCDKKPLPRYVYSLAI